MDFDSQHVDVRICCALLSTADVDTFDVDNTRLKSPFVVQFVERNWQVTQQLVSRWKKLAEIHNTDLELCELSDRLFALRAHAELSTSALLEFVDELTARNVEYCVLKGSAVRHVVYTDPTDRASIDIDIGINDSNVEAVENSLRELEYYQSRWDPNNKRFMLATEQEKLHLRGNHYELGYNIRREMIDELDESAVGRIKNQLKFSPNPWHVDGDGGLGIYLNIDAHTGLSLDISAQEIIECSEVSMVSGEKILVPSYYWLLFHLVYKIYWEGVHNYRKGAYQYADLQLLIPLLSREDFEAFVALIDRYNLASGAIYVLRRLKTDLYFQLPDFVIEFLSERSTVVGDQGPIEENNLGDMWPKLFGLRSL